MKTLWMPAATLAVLAMGCSDPAPTPAAVGLTLSIHVPNTPIPNSTCPATGQSEIGNPPPNGNPLNPGGRITDGKSDVDVSCTVKGDSTFTVSGTIQQGATRFNISGGRIDGASKTGTFNASMFTPVSSELASESTAPCTFDATEPPLEVSKGNLFARFNCPALWRRDEATPIACGGSGLIVLEFCQE